MRSSLPHAVFGAAFSLLALGCADEGVTVETWFCRTGECDTRLATAFDAATTRIDAAVYAFNRAPLSDALARAAERGVEVRLVVETGQAANKKAYNAIAGRDRVTVRCDGNSAFMHHKFAVVDGALVTTGSYNWTDQATNQHDENLVVLHSPDVATRYTGEFERVLAKSTQCDPAVWERGSSSGD